MGNAVYRNLAGVCCVERIRRLDPFGSIDAEFGGVSCRVGSFDCRMVCHLEDHFRRFDGSCSQVEPLSPQKTMALAVDRHPLPDWWNYLSADQL